MLVQEEESSTRGIQDEEETTTSVEEEGSAMNTEDLVEIDQHDKKNLAEQGYHGGEGDQRVQSVSERVFNETSTAENQDSSTEMDLEWSTTEEAAGQVLTEIENMTEVDLTEKQDADQVTTKLLHTLIALSVFCTLFSVLLLFFVSHFLFKNQEPSVLPAASFQTIVLTPSIAHIPLENQEVTMIPC